MAGNKCKTYSEQFNFQNKCNGEKVPLSQEYKRLAQILIEKEKILLEKLEDNAELKKLFSEFGDAEMQTHARSVFEFYRDGFFTGFRLAMEMFDGSDA